MMSSDKLFRVGILAAIVAMGLGSHAVAEPKSAVPAPAAAPAVTGPGPRPRTPGTISNAPNKEAPVAISTPRRRVRRGPVSCASNSSIGGINRAKGPSPWRTLTCVSFFPPRS